MMNRLLMNKVQQMVKQSCYQETNIFGTDIWVYHIVPVVKYSAILAEKLNIDVECAILSGYLHDYASVINKDYYPEHHIYGAKIAEEVLVKEGYPADKIDIIKKNILNHRGSVNNEESSLEIVCLASADAMAHITGIPSLLYLAYVRKKMSIDEGREWVLQKITRSWGKLCNEAKEIVKDQYNSALLTLSKE